MGETISFRLGKELGKDLAKVEKKWQIDRRLLLNAMTKWKIENALNDIMDHKISIGKAAKDCEISVWEVLDMLKEKNLDWTNYRNEDLDKDLSFIK